MNINKIHVAIVRSNLSDDYNRHTAATMVSAMKNCSCPIVFHILHEEKLSAEDRVSTFLNIQRYQELVQEYSCEIQFHNVILPEWINKDNIPNIAVFNTVAGFYRFFISDILRDINRVISLGSDVIIETDLSKLYSIDMTNYSIAGCIEQNLPNLLKNSPRVKRYFASVNMPLETFINGDVLIFNLEKIRAERTLPKSAIEYLLKNPNTPFLEQDVFSQIFQKEILILPERYNILVFLGDQHTQSLISDGGDKRDYILHFGGKKKPWSIYTSPYDMEYWYYLSLTPWGAEEKVFAYLQNVVKSEDEIVSSVMNNIVSHVWEVSLTQKIRYLFNYSVGLVWGLMYNYVNLTLREGVHHLVRNLQRYLRKQP